MTNLGLILKNRDITSLTKVHIVKAMVFPTVYGCESWTIKARIDEASIVVNEELMSFNCGAVEDQPLRVPWRARRSNQSILSEINSEYSLGGLMLMLKLQYFGYLMLKDDSLEKTLMGKSEGKRRRGRQRKRWLGSIANSMDINLSKLWETVEDRGVWSAAVHGVANSWS